MSNTTKPPVTDATRERLIETLRVIILASEEQLVTNEKISKPKEIKDTETTISIFTLDVASALKAYLEMPKSNRFWEGVLIFKYLYMIIFESHNKIAYKRFIDDDGKINEVKTECNKKASLWYGKISLLQEMMTSEERIEYNAITADLESFWNDNDWNYITKIRNRMGHYGDIDTYAKDMLTIDVGTIIGISAVWALTLSRIQTFVGKLYLRVLKQIDQLESQPTS